MSSAIEWTDETWNPTTGCDHVLDVPLRWRKPRRVFVNSMSDLFHPKVTDEFIDEVFGVMAVASIWRGHTFQVLTKRPKRMRAFLLLRRMRIANAAHRWAIDRVSAGWLSDGIEHGSPDRWPLPGVWLGTSVEDQQRADERIPPLLETPAAVRFLSCEPLLGPVTLPQVTISPPEPIEWDRPKGGYGELLHWIIVGGESGPGARPMHPQWARDLRDQAVAAGVPFFFKQWGAWVPYEPDAQPPLWNGQDGETIDGHHLPADLSDGEPFCAWWAPEPTDAVTYLRVGGHGGRHLDGRTWDEFPTEVGA